MAQNFYQELIDLNMAAMDLSIIIVNWNSKDYLKESISSIIATTYDMAFEIIVIDGASFDGCGEMLRRLYPQVLFIQSERNLGFAKANNEAYKVSCGRNLLFLNPDTEMTIGTISEMLRCLDTVPEAGIAGARLLNSDRSIQTSCIQAFPSILNQFIDSEALRQRFPLWRIWGMAPLYKNLVSHSKVDAVSGACLMIKRAVFESVGMFSTDFFMYSEDIDLCFKARKAGFKTFYVPSATVVHYGGSSSSKSDESSFSSVMLLESQWRFFRKNYSAAYAWIYRVAMFYLSIARVGMIFGIWLLQKMLQKKFSFQGALQKWTSRLRWALGFEGWAKKIS